MTLPLVARYDRHKLEVHRPLYERPDNRLSDLIKLILQATEKLGYYLSALALAIIALASLMPSGGAGDPGSADKIMHLVSYAVATLPAALASPHRPLRVFGVIVGWSSAIELLQPLVGREAGLGDVFANAAGVAIGLGVSALFRAVLEVA